MRDRLLLRRCGLSCSGRRTTRRLEADPPPARHRRGRSGRPAGRRRLGNRYQHPACRGGVPGVRRWRRPLRRQRDARQRRRQAAGVADRAQFHHGDADALPLPDGGYDAVVCECALCTFPDKVTAASEMARVLRPGGRVGITDVTAVPDRLPLELTGSVAWVACIADARPVEDCRAILARAGFRVTTGERHAAALEQMAASDRRPSRAPADDPPRPARSSASTSAALGRSSTPPRARSETASWTTCCWSARRHEAARPGSRLRHGPRRRCWPRLGPALLRPRCRPTYPRPVIDPRVELREGVNEVGG